MPDAVRECEQDSTSLPSSAWLEEADAHELHRVEWLLTARDNQLPPDGFPHGAARTWMVLAGRGFGKTRTAAEYVAAYGMDNPGSRISLVGETFGDGRDVMIEGESGLLSCLPLGADTGWNRSMGELLLPNGTRYKLYSGDKPGQLRGPQSHLLWTDELAKHRYAREAWTQGQLGLRLGDYPHSIVTTTPRPIALIKELMERANVAVTRGSTFDNAANLADVFLDEVRRRYEGTSVGKQELYGEYLAEVEGALWSRALIERRKTREIPPMNRIVVGVDPAASTGENSDLTGIVVAGLGEDGRGYVLYSTGVRLSPNEWACKVSNLYEEYGADRVVAEKNQGGLMVESVLRASSARLPLKLVHASKGKRTRAEPVATLFERGEVDLHITQNHSQLEDEMCSYTGAPGEASPDVMDAMVYALTELMLTPSQLAKVFSF